MPGFSELSLKVDFRASPEDIDALDALCTKYHKSRAAVIRQLIRTAKPTNFKGWKPQPPAT